MKFKHMWIAILLPFALMGLIDCFASHNPHKHIHTDTTVSKAYKEFKDSVLRYELCTDPNDKTTLREIATDNCIEYLFEVERSKILSEMKK